MIESFTYVSKLKSAFPWADNVVYFKANPKTVFKPGLNIVYGPNASGKSTMVRMMARYLAAEQGGVSCVTETWLNDICGFGETKSQMPCEMAHDGRPLMFYDARATPGLIGGGFDDDFFSEGIANTMAKGSTGQLGFNRMSRMLNVLLKKEAPQPAAAASKPARKKAPAKASASPAKPQSEIPWRVNRSAVNDHWSKKIAVADALLEAKCAKGPRTLIFDEPESGYSLLWQRGIWENVFSRVNPDEFQVIVATHSPFALGVKGANYIEMEPNIVATSTASILELATRILTNHGT